MKINRIIATVGAGALLAAGGVLGFATSASAHNATLTGTAACDAVTGSATITWTLSNDYGEATHVTVSNDTAIPVGAVVPAAPHDPTVKTFTEQVTAPAAGKAVTATLNMEWQGDHYTQNGVTATVTVGKDCTIPVPPTPKDATAAPIVITVATCDTAGTATVGGVQYATLTGALDETPGAHTASFTATVGHQFANGATTFSEPYTVPAQLSGDQCAPPPVDPIVCVANGTSDTEAGDLAPVQGPGGLVFDGPTAVGQARDLYYRVSAGNAQALTGIGYTVTEQSGYGVQIVVEVNPNANLGHGVIHYATISTLSLAGTGTKSSLEGQAVWYTSKIDYAQPGGQGDPLTLPHLVALMPNNTLLSSPSLHLQTASTAGTHNVVTALTSSCGSHAYVPVKPADVVTSTVTPAQQCVSGTGTETDTTITTTTGFVWDTSTAAYVKGDPTEVTSITTKPLNATVCPVVVKAAPQTPVRTLPAAQLADTGSSPAAAIVMSLIGLILGSGLVVGGLLFRRRTAGK